MADAPISTFCRRLRGMLSWRGSDDTTDLRLLELFVASRDEAAFAALMRRHGPMVLGVCRRVLNHSHDAEDAFQATFLVLARKAAGIGRRELLGNWLYGVAYRTALKAKVAAARRRRRDDRMRLREAPTMPTTEPTVEAAWQELRPVLDQELARLPAKYRVPIILCYLEGKTHEEVARQLGWPTGTVAGRLARARAVLRERLTRRGLTLTGIVLLSALSSQAASAAVPASLIVSTAHAATLIAAGQAATGAVSASVAALTKGVLQSMLFTQLKLTTLCLVGAGLAVAGVGSLMSGPTITLAASASQGLSLPAAVKAAAAAEDDLARFQGTWKIVSAEGKNEALPEDARQVMRFVFTGNNLVIKAAGVDEDRALIEFKLDPNTTPKAIDLTEANKNKCVKGIYHFDADTLKLSFVEKDGAERPTSFKAEKGSDQLTFVLKRVSKDDKPSPEAAEKVKEAAARSISANNLKQIAIAMHNYYSVYQHLPGAAINTKDGKPLLSWRVAILPFVEQDNLYKQFKLDEPWDSEHNKKLIPMMPKLYAPTIGKTAAPNTTFYRVFVGNGAAFEPDKEITFADITDGTSNTILAVEAGEAVPWTKPDELNYDPKKPLPKLGGNFKSQFPVGFCDGSVRFIPMEFDEQTFRAIITRNGGEVINSNELNKKK